MRSSPAECREGMQLLAGNLVALDRVRLGLQKQHVLHKAPQDPRAVVLPVFGELRRAILGD
jgi:hypothetical protein